MIFNNITELIGNTPIVKLNRIATANCYAKLEYFNPLHSVKDRPALYMISGAEMRGELKAGGTIIEPTSGNTGIGLAYIGRQKGYKVILTMPSSMSIERVKLLKALGAEIILTDKSLGMRGAIDKANELMLTYDNAFMPMQFANNDNVKAHIETTAQEIIRDFKGKNIDYFVAGVGSGGTIVGVGTALKSVYPNIKIVAVEPKESPMLSTGVSGPHGIQGIGANFVPGLFDKSIVDTIITITTADAINFSKKAISEEGLLVGISSGAALAGVAMIAKDNPNATILTLLPDTGERYISTALFE